MLSGGGSLSKTDPQTVSDDQGKERQGVVMMAAAAAAVVLAEEGQLRKKVCGNLILNEYLVIVCLGGRGGGVNAVGRAWARDSGGSW